jgi:hypothetical protein
LGRWAGGIAPKFPVLLLAAVDVLAAAAFAASICAIGSACAPPVAGNIDWQWIISAAAFAFGLKGLWFISKPPGKKKKKEGT